MKIKKLTTKKQDNRTKKITLGIILVSIMLLSTVGYVFNMLNPEENQNIIEYNGTTFQKWDEYWIFEKNNKQLALKHNPTELTNITTPENIIKLKEYINEPLYIDIKNQEQKTEIMRTISQFTQRTQPACLDTECEETLPIKNCTQDNFITIKTGNQTSITQQNKCIFITAPQEGLTKTTDKFIYTTLEI